MPTDDTQAPLSFGERLVLAEEHRRDHDQPPASTAEPPSRPQSETVVMQREETTTNGSFHISEPGQSLPVAGPGTLVSAVVIAETDQFDVFVELDDQTVASAPAATLRTRSAELERIAVYERENGDTVVTVSDYQFQQHVDVVITPQESITFPLQRAEVDVVRGGDAT